MAMESIACSMRSNRSAFSGDGGACFGIDPRFQNNRAMDTAMGDSTKSVNTTDIGMKFSIIPGEIPKGSEELASIAAGTEAIWRPLASISLSSKNHG